jgi:hypothetical protein
MKASVKGWRSWNRFDWSEALLEHYFGATETSDPVRALVVVGEELVRVVGDPEAQSLEVESLLVQKVLRGAGDNNFWFHAKTAAGSSKPHYLGHLITACLAATDLDDSDENSYIARLADITGSARGDLNLEVMAELWRHLSTWLGEHSDEYRPLVLPDPGGWTRIGYTVKLAFPSRRDQVALARVLSSGNLTVEDPPVGLVIDAVIAASRTAFSDRFRFEFDAFRRNRDAGLSSSVLRESPFWLAVRATADVSVSDRDGTVHWALLASDDGFDLDLQVVSDGEVIGGSLETVELDERIGRWTHEAKGNPSNDDPVAVLLDGLCSLPAISLLVKGGLIPLVEELHGNLESNGRREALPEAHAALVSDPLVAEVTSRFGSPRSRPRACGVEGWKFLEGLALRVASSRELRGTPLGDCWILHESPSPTRIRIVGGVRVGSAWLGTRHLLPAFRVESATSMSAHTSGATFALRHDETGAWELPSEGFEGPLEVVAVTEDQTLRGQMEFVRSPSTEGFRVPGSPDSWVYEDQARSRPFAHRWSEDTPGIIEIADVERTVYLGRDVGAFLDGPGGAAWAVVEFGTARIIRSLVSLEESVPRGQVPDPGARRRWRRNLKVDAATSCEPGVVATLRRIISNTSGQKDLPTVAGGGDGRMSPSPRIPPHPRLDDVVTAAVAISNRQVGLDRRRFTAFLCETLAVEPVASPLIVRAWQEAGLLDELVNVRWSGRKLLAVPPHFKVFHVTSGFRATFCGLSLDVTTRELASKAVGVGMTVSRVEACSPFVPKTIIVQADSLDQITQLATQLRLPVHFIPANPYLSHDGRDLNGDPPRIGYRTEPAEVIGDTVEIARTWQRGAPSFWTIRTGELTTWTHFLEAARFWARVLAGTLEVDLRGSVDFTLGTTRMPLTAARWLSVVGGSRSGPTGPEPEDPYVYSAPTGALRTHLLDELRRFEVETGESMQWKSEGDLSHV